MVNTTTKNGGILNGRKIMEEKIIQYNKRYEKYEKHKRHKRIMSQTYNRRTSYEARRAKAYTLKLWQETHTILMNTITAMPPRTTPRWQYHQLPPSATTPTSPPTHKYKRRTDTVILVDDTGQATVITALHEPTPHTIFETPEHIRIRAYQISPDKLLPEYTYNGTITTRKELAPLAHRGVVYKATEILL